MITQYFLVSILLLSSKAESQVVKSFSAFSEIYARFATTTVVNVVDNKGSTTAEITFTAVIPERAFVSNFTITTGGQTTVGRVLEKAEADRVFHAAKTASVLISEREKLTSRTFEVKVRVPGGQKTRLELTYQELLERKASYYRHFIHVPETSEGFRSVTVDVIISDRNNIRNIYVPWISPKLHHKTTEELLKLPKNTNLVLSHKSSLAYLFYSREEDKGGDMIVMFDVEQPMLGGDIFVMNGYFVHFITTDKDQQTDMDQKVVFVLDKSGSMKSPINDRADITKFYQVKLGLEEMLKELESRDKLSVVMFSSDLHVWKERLEPASDANKKDILNRYFPKAREGGGTDIEKGVMEAFRIVNQEPKRPRLCNVVFLTDGKATLGEKNLDILIGKIREANRFKCRLYTVGFGTAADVDDEFLNRLARENGGFSRVIYTDSDADVQLKGFFNEIAHVFLHNVNINYVPGSVNLSSLILSMNELIQGSGTVSVGQLANDGPAIRGVVRGTNNNGKTVAQLAAVYSGALPCQMPLSGMSLEVVEREIQSGVLCDRWLWSGGLEKQLSETALVSVPERIPSSPHNVEGIIERAFAFETVKKLIADFMSTQNLSAHNRALDMALKYNFVTELTSMVAVDEVTETADSRPLTGLAPPPPPNIVPGLMSSGMSLEGDMNARGACVSRDGNCAAHGRLACKGEDSYTGDKASTASGHTCQRWDSQYPHEHDYSPFHHNLCRNYGGDEAPWCFTTNPNVRWEYCFTDCYNSSVCQNKADSCARRSKAYCDPSNEDNYWMITNCCEECKGVEKAGTVKPTTRPAQCIDKHHLCIHLIGHPLGCGSTNLWKKRCPKTCKQC